MKNNRFVPLLGTSRGTVTVTAPSALTYSSNPVSYSEDDAITTNSPSSSGGAVSFYSVSPALPTGLSLNADNGRITGTPTTPTAQATYTVTATNGGGSTTCDVVITITSDSVSAPADQSNLLMWFKGDAGVTQVANATSAWADQSGNVHHALQAVAGAKPTYSASDVAFNNMPVLSFDGGDILSTATSPSFGKHTILVVFSSTVAGVIVGRRLNADADIDYLYPTIGRTSLVRRSGTLDGKENVAGLNWGVDGTARTFVRRYDGTHAGHLLRVNGAAMSTTDNGASSAGTAAVAGTFNIGDDSSASRLTGKIAEIVVFDDDIGATRVGDWELYLKSKYAHYA